MPYHSARARTLAAASYDAHPRSLTSAVADFKTRAPTVARQISKLKVFVKRWGQRLKKSGNTLPMKKSGRPRKLSPEDMQLCIKAFLKGFRVGDQFRPFTSINNAVLQCPALHHTCVTHQIKPKNLLEMMRRARASLKKVKKRVRTPFTVTIKNYRMKVAQSLYDKDSEFFSRIFFIDAKKIHVMPLNMAVWVDPKQDEFILEDRRRGASGQAAVTMQFYAMVNAKLGPVSLVFTTGTTGRKGFQGKVYTVSDSPYMFRVKRRFVVRWR
jgi:hypothetical protein